MTQGEAKNLLKKQLFEKIPNKGGFLYNEVLKIWEKVDLAKGDKGDKPIPGIDFPIPRNGYTPVKGVDYKDGYTPVKNVDYVDGKDGYTPIKGIDYVDGVNGVNGNDGSPDTAQQIVDKLNTLNQVLNPEVIIGLTEAVVKDLNNPKVGTKLSTEALNQPARGALDQRWHGGGLTTVHHDNTLTGDGTLDSLLSVVGASGFGDVFGPASSIDNGIVLFNGITGKLIKDSGILLSSKYDTSNPANYTTIAAVSALPISTFTNDVPYLVSGDLSNYVQGPASATDNAISRFDGTTGKLIQNSTVLIDDTGNISVAPGVGGNISLNNQNVGSSTTSIYGGAGFNSVGELRFTAPGDVELIPQSSNFASIVDIITGYRVYLNPRGLTGSRTFTFPDASGQLSLYAFPVSLHPTSMAVINNSGDNVTDTFDVGINDSRVKWDSTNFRLLINASNSGTSASYNLDVLGNGHFKAETGSTSDVYFHDGSNTAVRVISGSSDEVRLLDQTNNWLIYSVSNGGNGLKVGGIGGNNIMTTYGLNVGIDVASPNYILDVKGVMQVDYNNGNVRFLNGTVSNPELTSQNDTDTGIFWDGSNGLHFAASSNDIMKVEYNSNGIITTISPIKFTIGGGIGSSGNNTFNIGTSNGVGGSDTQLIGSQNSSVSTPAFTFYNDLTTGIYRANSHDISFANQGNITAQIFDTGSRNIFLLTPGNSSNTPAYSFFNNTGTGMDYDTGVSQLRFFLSGTAHLGIDSNGVRIPYNGTFPGNSGVLSIGANNNVDIYFDGQGRIIFGNDGSFSAGSPQIVLNNSGNGFWYDTNNSRLSVAVGSNISAYFNSQGIFTLQGSQGNGGYSFINDPDTNIWNPGSDEIGFAGGGNEIFRAGYYSGSYTQIRSYSDGTAAHPAYSFRSHNQDIGMFIDTDNLAFASSGTKRMDIDTNGKVYIKTFGTGNGYLNVSDGTRSAQLSTNIASGYFSSGSYVFEATTSSPITTAFYATDGTAQVYGPNGSSFGLNVSGYGGGGGNGAAIGTSLYAIITSGNVLISNGGTGNGDLAIAGDTYISSAKLFDSAVSAGSSGDVLTSTGTQVLWKNPGTLIGASVLTSVSLTNQGADIGSTNFTGANVAGLYRVSYTLENTTTDVTAGAVTLTIAYTDGVGAATFPSTAVPLTGVGIVRTQGTIFIQLASGSISYSTSHTGIFGTSKYALYMTVERLK